jgi:hypothetical protein
MTYAGQKLIQRLNPKLSLKPSEIVERQIYVSFQHDRGCVLTRHHRDQAAYVEGGLSASRGYIPAFQEKL